MEKQLWFAAPAQRSIILEELACVECTLSMKFKARFNWYAVLTERLKEDDLEERKREGEG